MGEVGKILIIFGILMVVLGIFLIFWNKIPLIGKLPGDIIIRRKNFVFYFPITTSILISVILSLIFYIIGRLK